MSKILTFLLLLVLLFAQQTFSDQQYYPEQVDQPPLTQEVPSQQYEQNPAEQPQRNVPQNPFDHPPADPTKKGKKGGGEFRPFGYRNEGGDQLPAQGAKMKRSSAVYDSHRNAWKQREGQMQGGEDSWVDFLMDSNIAKIAVATTCLLVVIRMCTKRGRPRRMAPRHVVTSIKLSNSCFQEQVAADDTVNSQGIYAAPLQNHLQRSQNTISPEDEQ